MYAIVARERSGELYGVLIERPVMGGRSTSWGKLNTHAPEVRVDERFRNVMLFPFEQAEHVCGLDYPEMPYVFGRGVTVEPMHIEELRRRCRRDRNGGVRWIRTLQSA